MYTYLKALIYSQPDHIQACIIHNNAQLKPFGYELIALNTVGLALHTVELF